MSITAERKVFLSKLLKGELFRQLCNARRDILICLRLTVMVLIAIMGGLIIFTTRLSTSYMIYGLMLGILCVLCETRLRWYVLRHAKSVLRLTVVPIKFILNCRLHSVIRPFMLGAVSESEREHHEAVISELLALLIGEGDIEPEERKLIRSVFSFQDTIARQVMTPRINVVALRSTDKLKRVVELALDTGYSKFPVYENRIDNIIGVLYIKDVLRYLLMGNLNVQVKELAKQAYYIPETKKIDDLLKEMQTRKLSIAIVLDEYGGFSGIVTLEDILEELVGEIQDEHERHLPPIERISDTSFSVDPRLPLEDIRELIDDPEFSELTEHSNAETIGGLIYELLDRVPQEGEKVNIGEVEIEISKVNNQRLERLTLTRLHKRNGPSS